MIKKIEEQFEEHIELVKQNLGLIKKIDLAAAKIISCIEKGGKVLIAGNGGSAADSQHIAAELIGRYEKERVALSAISLTTDTSILTAWSNDDCFENIFSRQIEGLGKKGDVFIGITTSGNSENIIRAVKKAKEKNMTTIVFLGKNGGKMKGLADVELLVVSNRTSRIQEIHMLCYHILCGLIEESFS
ncbi:MAG: D-sedoheptulose 7-phosphate isomerase [Nanoarchaeota archaeon]|nr:D-sedoheptulose 7-phosphate isomerase [Nanoarchaeota archaeon]